MLVLAKLVVYETLNERSIIRRLKRASDVSGEKQEQKQSNVTERRVEARGADTSSVTKCLALVCGVSLWTVSHCRTSFAFLLTLPLQLQRILS